MNYFDRIVLSVLNPTIKADLGITDISYGWIAGAFQIAYTFGSIAAGRFIDKVGTRLGYTLSMFFWSVAAIMHSFCYTAFSLGFWRGTLGLTESGNFPVAIKAVSEWFKPHQRSFATGLFNSGASVASIVGPPLIAAITLNFGWRWAFSVFGAAGIVLAVIWHLTYKESVAARTASTAKLKWSQVIKYKQTYGIILGKFLTDPVWWFYIFWIPTYLADKRGFNLKSIAIALPIVYTVSGLSGIAGGWIPGYLMKLGWPVGKARKLTMGLCAALLPISIMAVKVNNPWLAVALMSLAGGAHNVWAVNIFTLASDCFPQSAVGSVTGLGTFGGSLGGFLMSTFLVGYIVTWFGYVPVFILMGIVHPLAFLSVCLLIKDVRQVELKA